MKKLYIFSIRSFTGPFIVTFLISMFMLIMQFFWLYIDDLMGKGLEILVLLELLFYVSASLIPLALPLAMLLSSIMTFGNLAENNELTALKSSGLSLIKIMRPLMTVVFILSICTFFFSNYVIPVANLKWRSLIYDIQETKISAVLTPGKYSKDFDNFAIKIQDGNENSFQGIIIHDHSNTNIIKTIRAEKGEILKSENGNYLVFHLLNGSILEELSVKGNATSNELGESGSFHPNRKTHFEDATYRIDVSGFKLNRSDEDLFKNSHEMLNVFQLNSAVDSIYNSNKKLAISFVEAMEYAHPYFQSKRVNQNQLKAQSDSSLVRLQTDAQMMPSATTKKIDRAITYKELKKEQKIQAIQGSISAIRGKKEQLEGQRAILQSIDSNVARFYVEFHRKFALSGAIIVLFFIGAPLGAIVKKGGFGAPVVIAALLFMVYFVLMSIGDNLANELVVSPFLGMWMPTFVLAPFAFILMRSAGNDRPIINKEKWGKFIPNFKRKKG